MENVSAQDCDEQGKLTDERDLRSETILSVKRRWRFTVIAMERVSKGQGGSVGNDSAA